MHPDRRAAFDALKAGQQPAGWMWGDLLSSPELAFPWPYNLDVIDALVSGFREDVRKAGALEIVAVARRCLAAKRAKTGLEQPANPAGEVAELARALNALEARLKSLTPEAQQCLWDGVALTNADAASPVVLLGALYAFRSANGKLGRVEADPAARKGGRPPERLRSWVLTEMSTIFDRRQEQLTRGRPAFLEHAIAPLGFAVVEPATMRRTLERTIRKGRPPE